MLRGLRGAAALLRGAAGLTLASHCATPAGAGAQAAAELARWLGQGCAARHAATAAGDDQSGRGPPKRRAPNVGKYGEKTADGRPKPDERTVADLVRRGWFKSEEAAVALLTRKKTNNNRYAFETAERAADWLEATLGPEPVKDGLCPAARAVKGDPLMLARDAAALQRKWDALTLPAERGGVGIELSTEQAREAVRKYPPLLGHSVETYKTGWSMLTATGDGLGLSPEEARKCILRGPEVLSKDNGKVVLRVKLLESLGFLEARTMVLAEPRVLNFKEATVRGTAAWWQQSGLDHVKLVTALPTLIGSPKATELQARLDFLRRVVGMSNAELNNAASLFTRSLDGRLRPRFFYALQRDRLARFGTINTMMQATDAAFLAMMQGKPCTDRTSEAEVTRYREHVASPEFVTWRREQEARMLQHSAT